MKIIATVTNDLTTDQRMLRICSSLANGGHEVLLVGRELTNSHKLTDRPFGQKRFRLFFKRGKLFYFEYNLRLFIFLLFQNFDVVYSVDLDSLLPGFFICRLRRKICVYDAHEYFTELPEVVGRPLVKKAWNLVANFCIPKLKYAITVCESLSEIFTKKYGTRFEVVRNVPFKKEPPPVRVLSSKKEFTLIYQGVLNDGRGLEEMIDAMSFLPFAKLWLAGEGDLSNELKSMVKQKGLTEQIDFLGRLKPEDLAAVTLKADVGLNLLKNKGLNYYYSLANKAFDYIQAGLPSINMAFPEYEKLNEKYGAFVLLPDLKTESIVEAINELRSTEGQYQMLSESCLKAAKELTWEKEKQIFLGLFEKIKNEI